MADVSRRRVTYGQLEQLWEFLNQNKAIATGYNKTSQAREFSKKMWKNIAQNLNSHGDGAIKDWKGWCKYWNDYKSKIKRLAADTRASHQQTGGGPSQVRKMTDIEKKFLQILGDDFGTGLPNIRVEPFEQDIQETESGLDMDTTLNIGTGSVPTVLEGEGGSESILTLCPVQEMSQEIMEPGPSTRVTPPPPVSPPTLEHSTTTGAPDLQSTPRRSPRRRRHTRREPPMTQDAARRALIRISERRANIEEQNSETLKKLLQEMKEIKEILRLSEQTAKKMHALSKNHYYDVMKTAQEDTIIESDLSGEDCESRLAPTSEVGCYARAHLKSNAVQTHFTRTNKNFRNEYTATSDDDSVRTPDSPSIRGRYSIEHNQSHEDITVFRSRSSPFAGLPYNQQYPLSNSGKTAVIVEHAVDCIECFHRKQKRSALESKSTITNKMCNDKSTQCECWQCKMSTCNCHEYRYIPCNRGLAACRTFTLGTSESRRWQNEHCKTKLIGGCRVPVSKNYKSRF